MTQQSQSESGRLRGLFDAALQHYEKTTNMILAKHPLAEQLHNCHTIESTTKFLQDKVREFGDFRGSDKIMASIKITASILFMLSVNAASDGARDLVRPHQLMGVTISPPLMLSTVIYACESNANWPCNYDCCKESSQIPMFDSSHLSTSGFQRVETRLWRTRRLAPID